MSILTFVWQQGRKLVSGTMNGQSFVYRYDGNGMRYKKIVGDAKTDYYYNGTQLLLENRNGIRLYYIYGVTGIEGMLYRGQYYYFDKNTLGDIIAIRDDTGNVIARYTYDAWGNHTVYGQNGAVDRSKTSIGNINPFRYRGYYYDTETGFYYLQTRYYDPTICRFINADNYELVADLASVPGQLNMYAYCGNNPVMGYDPTGTEWDWNKFWGWVTVGATAVLAVAAIALVAFGVVSSGGVLGAALVGAGAGALIAMAGSISVQGGFSNADPWSVAKAGGIGGAIGGIAGISSWAVGTIGQTMGQYLGYAFSNATHISTGVNFGSVFGSQFLMNAGGLAGNIVGGLVGGTFGNHQANRLFGTELNSEEIMNQGFVSESPLWAIRFFRWWFV